MKPELNIPNLDKLIAHLEAQPPEQVNMGYVEVEEYPCGTCGCIAGHAMLLWPERIRFSQEISSVLGLDYDSSNKLTMPDGYSEEQDGVKRYPAHRVIATLKRLRDHYLATGEIVVDWGPEPSSSPWTAPKATEQTPPLPSVLTRFLAAEREEV